jgi:hypothetical protein
MHGRCAGVRVEVEEALARREPADHRAGVPVVEKEPGVEVLGEVHLEEQSVLGDDHRAPDVALPRVLCAPLLTPTDLQEDVGGIDVENVGDYRERLVQPAARDLGLDRGRGCVLGDVCGTLARIRPGPLVDVDRDRVLGQVGVVDAVAAHTGPARPLAEVARVLAQPVAQHGGPGVGPGGIVRGTGRTPRAARSPGSATTTVTGMRPL